MKYTLQLLKKKEIVKDVYALYFKKPEGFTFKAGQFLELNLPGLKPYYFSIASAPYEEDIMLATRWRKESIFKQALIQIDIFQKGELNVKGPYGNFTLHQETDVPAIFLAGGIGITPFLSIVKQSAENQLPQNQHLFYINKTTQDALFYNKAQAEKLTSQQEAEIMHKTLELVKKNEPFMLELYELRIKNPNFNFIPFMPLPTHIERIADYKKAKYYLCGSPRSIEGFKKLLESINIPKEQIKTEDFPGYLASY